MNLQFYFTLGIIASCIGLPESQGNVHHLRRRSVSLTKEETSKLGFLHAHAQEDAKGRGLFDMKGFGNMGSAFLKKFKTGPLAGVTMAPFKGPIEESPTYEAAMKGKYFAQIAKNFSVCREKPLHLTQEMVQAGVTCKSSKNLACYVTCAWKEIGVTQFERLDTDGTTAHANRYLKSQPAIVRTAYMKTFQLCFDEGARLVLGGGQCSKNLEVVNCMTKWFNKICIDGIDDVESPAGGEKTEDKPEKKNKKAEKKKAEDKKKEEKEDTSDD